MGTRVTSQMGLNRFSRPVSARWARRDRMGIIANKYGGLLGLSVLGESNQHSHIIFNGFVGLFFRCNFPKTTKNISQKILDKSGLFLLYIYNLLL